MEKLDENISKKTYSKPFISKKDFQNENYINDIKDVSFQSDIYPIRDKANNSNYLNDSITSNFSSKTRKPFEKVIFQSLQSFPSFNKEEDKIDIESNVIVDQTTRNQSITNQQDDEDDSYIKLIKRDLEEGETYLNDEERSRIKSLSKELNKEDVIKAIKYNEATIENIDELPFWVKYFIQDIPFSEKSSFFKESNKEEFIKNMISMTKNDARLYDLSTKTKEEKNKVKENIKILLTEINDISLDNSNSLNQDNKNENEGKNKHLTQLNKKLEDLYSKYDKKEIKKKVKEEISQDQSFFQIKNDKLEKLIENKKNYVEINKDIDYTLKKYQDNIKYYENLENIIEKNEKIDIDPRWASISDMDFSEGINIPENSLAFLRTENLGRLNELDKLLQIKQDKREKFEKKNYDMGVIHNSQNYPIVSALINTQKQVQQNKIILADQKELQLIEKRIRNKEDSTKPKQRETIFTEREKQELKELRENKAKENLKNKENTKLNLVFETEKLLNEVELKYKQRLLNEDSSKSEKYLENVDLTPDENYQQEISPLEKSIEDMKNSFSKLEEELNILKLDHDNDEKTHKLQKERLENKIETAEEKEFREKQLSLMDQLIKEMDEELLNSEALKKRLTQLEEDNEKLEKTININEYKQIIKKNMEQYEKDCLELENTLDDNPIFEEENEQ